MEETSQQVNSPSNGIDDHNYITNNDFLRHLCEYTSVSEPIAGASANHIAVGRLSDHPPVAELLEQISEITRRDALDGGAAGPPPEGAMPGGKHTDGGSQEVVPEPQKQAVSPARASLETPLAGSQPLHQRRQSRLKVTPAVTRVGAAAKSFVGRNAHNRSYYSHPAAIATGPALSDLRGLRLYTKETLPDIARETNGADSAPEHAYAATTIQSCSAGENAEIAPNTFEEVMTQPAKAHWKAASDKEMASLKKNYVFTLLPATSVFAGRKIIGSRWFYKVKANRSPKGRVAVLGWGQSSGIDCGSTFSLVCSLHSTRMVLAIEAEYNLTFWQLDYNTAFLNADVAEEVYVKMAPGYEQFDKNGVPLVMELLKNLPGLRQSPTN